MRYALTAPRDQGLETQMQATVTSRTGKQITLAFVGGGVTAAAGDINLGPVDRTADGFQARFPTQIGGKKVRVQVALDAANMVRADALFSAASQAVSAHTAEIDAYETHRAEVLRRLNQ